MRATLCGRTAWGIHERREATGLCRDLAKQLRDPAAVPTIPAVPHEALPGARPVASPDPGLFVIPRREHRPATRWRMLLVDGPWEPGSVEGQPGGNRSNRCIQPRTSHSSLRRR
jgi:hypothetical protein